MRVTQKQIMLSLQKNGGFITQTAKDIGVTYQAVWLRINRNEKLKAAYDEIREGYLDFAESKLIAQVREGNIAAICFFLKCQGKRRGYVEKQELQIDGTLNVKVVKFADDGNNDPK